MAQADSGGVDRVRAPASPCAYRACTPCWASALPWRARAGPGLRDLAAAATPSTNPVALVPQSAAAQELRELTWRPLAAPAAGWAPRALPTAISRADRARRLAERCSGAGPTGEPVAGVGDLGVTLRNGRRAWDPRSRWRGLPPGRAPLLPVGTGEWVESSVLHGHENRVNSAVFSPDGARVLTASADHTARLWDAASGKELRVLRGHEERPRPTRPGSRPTGRAS